MHTSRAVSYVPAAVTSPVQGTAIPAERYTAISGKVAGRFRSFEDARAFMRTLGLKSKKEWEAWKSSGKRPCDIPSTPQTTYASSGWTSYGDFLGYAEGQGARGTFRTFEDARAHVRTLGLKSTKEWEAWKSSGARPHDIPAGPEKTYKSSGWLSFGDFLGYAVGKEAQFRPRTNFRSFEDARAYVRTFGLKSVKEWEAWTSSGKRPHDIPSNPYATYASSGWLSYGDFVGYADGKVTGAHKRNAATAGLRALLDNGADNDEKDEQDGDDEDARRRKQAKRPRGG